MADDNSNDILAIDTDLLPDVKFNMGIQEQFAKDKGVVLEHWAAIPSTIGAKDRGDYRRPDSLDTISENGFIYQKVGEFTGTILGNSDTQKNEEGGLHDVSVGRLMLSKFYNKDKPSDSVEVQLLPGDRIYAKDIALKVPTYQKAQYEVKRPDQLQFPAICVSILKDSSNITYTQGKDFKIDHNGDIEWIPGARNPGVDSDTGLGRLYGVRYTYLAFWYIHQIHNEIRITNEGDSSKPTRLPYHASIQREYVYHNRTRGDVKDTNKVTETKRTTKAPAEKINPESEQFQVKVDVRNFE